MISTIVVRSPFSGSQIGEVPLQSANNVDESVRAAKRAMQQDALPAWERSEILRLCSQQIASNREELARLIAQESAKPISTARVEVDRAAATIRLSSEGAKRLSGHVLPMDGDKDAAGTFAYTFRVPVGVVGAISPFNFPLNLVAHKVGPAIASGCAVVLKPSSETPLSALLLANLLKHSGLPDGWLSVVTGSGKDAGNALVEHDDVSYISFTGSSEVGMQIQKRARGKRVGLELGNSTPMIVERDGDWMAAARAVSKGGFNHAGQSCISVQRVYVQREIALEFNDYLLSLVEDLKVGDPLKDETNVSSLINDAERDRVKRTIDEAIGAGASLLCGNTVDGSILMPALLVDATLDMRVCSDEIFGPVVAIQSYESFDEAIALANGTRYGLQASVFTSSLDGAMKAAEKLEFGGVMINESPTWRADMMPYGGVKASGNTREGPDYAIESMTEPRLVVIRR